MKRLLLLALGAAACRGRPPGPPGQADLAHLMDSLAPVVEHATGLRFRKLPRAEVISREQLRRYLEARFRQEYPGDRMRDLRDAYRLFTLLPDSTDLSRLFLDVLTEQVAGFYDPDSGAFFGVQGTAPAYRVTTVAHELVHALQDDYVPLDSILGQTDDADRLLAAQAVLEGQATLAMIRMQPGLDSQVFSPAFWVTVRDNLASAQRSMPVFATAPRFIRETLIFPYLSGAEFMRWWMTTHPDSIPPFGARMPTSTEQILLPSHYLAGDAPVPLRFSGGPADSAATDVVGDFGVRILLAELDRLPQVPTAIPLGWGGDRYILYQTPAGPALVWVVVWDSPVARDQFLDRVRGPWPLRARPGYRLTLDTLTVDGRPALRMVHAPGTWAGWTALPTAHVASR